MRSKPPTLNITSDNPTDAEIEDIKRRRAGIRASLACEGMVLTAEEEALLDDLEARKLGPADRKKAAIAFADARLAKARLAADANR